MEFSAESRGSSHTAHLRLGHLARRGLRQTASLWLLLLAAGLGPSSTFAQNAEPAPDKPEPVPTSLALPLGGDDDAPSAQNDGTPDWRAPRLNSEEGPGHGFVPFVAVTDVFRRELRVGEHLVLGACGPEGAEHEGATLLELFGPNGERVARGRGCNEAIGAWIVHRVEAPGFYTAQAQCRVSGCAGRLSWRVLPIRRGVVPFHPREELVRFEFEGGEILRASTCRLAGAHEEGNTEITLLGPDGYRVDGSTSSSCPSVEHVVQAPGTYRLVGGCSFLNRCGGHLGYEVSSETEVATTPAPARWRPGVFVAQATARASVSALTPGGAGVIDARLSYWPVEFIALSAGGTLAIGDGGEGRAVGAAAYGQLTLDFFDVALGVGGGIHTLNQRAVSTADDMLALVLHARVGRRSEVHGSAWIHLGLSTDPVSILRVEGDVRVPLGEFHLGLRGLGGEDGTILGELAFIWMPGPIGLRVSAGAAGVYRDRACGRTLCLTDFYVGPSAGLGFEWHAE